MKIDKSKLMKNAWKIAADAADGFGGRASEYIAESMKTAWREKKMRHIVAFSGGKDSTAMALLLKKKYPDREFEYVITPTGDELPEMDAHWEKMSALLGGLTVVSPQRDLFELIRYKKSLPNFQKRFCTQHLKIYPFIDYIEQFEQVTVYVGLRADEENRVGFMPYRAGATAKYPLREAGWREEDVLNFLKKNEIEIPTRTDCGVCFYQKVGEWRSLFENYPARYEKYVQLEDELGHTFRSPSRDTWPADLRNLRGEFLSGRKVRPYTRKKTQKCQFCTK